MSQTQDSGSAFMGRGLIGIEAVPAEQGGGVLIKCDCATTTHLVIDAPPGKYELAVTCDGCTTVRWFTITVAEAPDD